MNKILSCVFLLPFVLTKVNAQEKSIDEVVIEGKFLSLPYKKISENIEIITREQIQSSPAQSLADLLTYYTGVDIVKRGVADIQTDVSIRGGSFDQALLLINGMRLSDAQTGHNMMNLPITLTSIDRIEIIRGPAARKFGQNAYAGVINIVTKAFGNNQYKVNIIGADYQTWSLGAAADFGNKKSANLVELGHTESGGYRYNTDYKVTNLWYQNHLKMGAAKLDLQAGFIEKKFGANGFYDSLEAKDQYEETQTSLVGAIYSQTIGNFGVNANLYWRRAQDKYIYIRDRPEFYRNMHIGNTYGGGVNVSYSSWLGVTGIGAELHQEDLRSNNLGNRGRFVTQLLAEHHFFLINKKLSLIPGISWIHYAQTGAYFYPGLDIGFDLNEKHKLYANIAKVHRLPTYTDLYYKSPKEQGNIHLVPENALSYELGYRLRKNQFSFKTSIFGRDSKNAIDWLRANEQSIWTVQNLAEIKTMGMEAELAYSLNDFVKRISAAYTYLDSRAASAERGLHSRYILGNLRHQLNAKITMGYGRFTNELIYQYKHRMAWGGYHILDEKLRFNTHNLDIFLLVNNLFNTRYTGANFVPMPRRWFQLGVVFKNGF
ncbi:TonB-dependent receptor [Elizabethkingia argentiflava]|uniref:TonB-dependent receptor n=1 Tax=Elizabethkingia argenteiflava TaxID=2681556 RepID=A0A845PRQ5_9FLAO|nr:TonB-dependent receptor [Elizabethkingia argenteiflava]NAW50882.1 TonB-dependent receptor [Elizabethkingia argenteiflava]